MVFHSLSSILRLLCLGFAAFAQAQTLFTTDSVVSDSAGASFDLTNNAMEMLIITSWKFLVATTSADATVELYYKSGTQAGSISDETVWTKLGETVPLPEVGMSEIDVGDSAMIGVGETTGFFIYSDGGTISYGGPEITTVTSDDSLVTFDAGSAFTALYPQLSTEIFTPRGVSMEITYTEETDSPTMQPTAAPSVVPELFCTGDIRIINIARFIICSVLNWFFSDDEE
mmetsp:Transcript_28957/g.44501  ORF Transcript_28957/g.44501 Transcript_28957/m.44501 type:complete len:229 (-) Transcript_28957:268-954(-)|eukprot:CAMPEP_0118702528 /NCGR_PEP_ID=MMETSP0800-20121206/17945_1 /TAXON_ID=210618 ORGANISM="Striatella unipunctata, Strain CCMP2910" /NCGR_SAMPLE_ID=MMETSP0800 /ASSEMBLY_ACC=CAM_ASM_000638 /LENGTH=228 /DNA_ID=CAMNT_0006603747 /DNA_START=30 /DNA_END=716 /DNA_ORIENTATION=-